MKGNGENNGVIGLGETDMAALLPALLPTGLFEGSDSFGSGANWQLSH